MTGITITYIVIFSVLSILGLLGRAMVPTTVQPTPGATGRSIIACLILSVPITLFLVGLWSTFRIFI